MATMPPRQRCAVVQLLDNAFLHNEEAAVYKDKKHHYLVTASYHYGLARTVVSPDGSATDVGAGPVETLQRTKAGFRETTRWTKVAFDYINPPDRMLLAAGCALNRIPRTKLDGEFADSYQLVSMIDGYLRQRHGKAAHEFVGVS